MSSVAEPQLLINPRRRPAQFKFEFPPSIIREAIYRGQWRYCCSRATSLCRAAIKLTGYAAFRTPTHSAFHRASCAFNLVLRILTAQLTAVRLAAAQPLINHAPTDGIGALKAQITELEHREAGNHLPPKHLFLIKL